jgi:hypothetical protein
MLKKSCRAFIMFMSEKHYKLSLDLGEWMLRTHLMNVGVVAIAAA